MSEAYTFNDYRGSHQRLVEAISQREVAAVCDLLESVYRTGGALWACGNGGSAANASHFCEDLAKLMWDEARGTRMRVAALTESTPFISALANDDGYERIFEIQLAIQSSPGDALLCISGSGNSPNVLRAAAWAATHGLRTVGLTGYDGGALARRVNVHLNIASHNMGMLECVHLLLLDYISKELRFRAYGTSHSER